jgi:predicted HicB family RNase H-like nuclease
MARKRVEKPVIASPAETKLKPVRLDLEPDVHRLLRLVAAHDGASMASYARDALENHVREEAKKRGIKV